ncbi:hypothetical protein [Candidatus Enterococcus ikei]|uniref:Alanine racemase C-terminal domain-containing protein n=1 Tax=Candidatus Enterococcus ikei TaxID=2815326 RepID=A0ABS3GVH6_9ENTE|nr:hypothetical protein [Enterococcus sp. DIV0869a]MBO0439261.1 hypothetical protein [Enterococcus sp. DIV0869a]
MNDKNCINYKSKYIQCNIKRLSKLISPEKLYVVCKSDNYGLGNAIFHLLKNHDDYINGYCVSDLEITHRLNFEFVIPSCSSEKIKVGYSDGSKSEYVCP